MDPELLLTTMDESQQNIWHRTTVKIIWDRQRPRRFVRRTSHDSEDDNLSQDDHDAFPSRKANIEQIQYLIAIHGQWTEHALPRQEILGLQQQINQLIIETRLTMDDG